MPATQAARSSRFAPWEQLQPRLENADLDLGFRPFAERGIERRILLGGFGEQDDCCLLTASFLARDGRILSRGVLPPVRAAEREKRTALLRRSATGPVPREACSVVVRLEAFASAGANDGYADELALVIRRPL